MKNLSKLIAGALAAVTLGLTGLAAPTARAAPILTGNFSFDNYGFVYLSTSATTLGTLIGSSATWNPATAITATTLLPGTTYYLNVEAINGDPSLAPYSTGGFLGGFALSGAAAFANGTTSLLTGTSGWTSIYNDSNYSDTAQTWVTPSVGVLSEGANGIGPWGTIGGISGSADWIWGADANSSGGSVAGEQCAACTVDFQATIITAAVPEPAGWTVLLVGLAGLAGARTRRLNRRGVRR